MFNHPLLTNEHGRISKPIGNPYHGLVVDGDLELPNGEVVTWPRQPDGAHAWLFGVPGMPEVERTTEEQEDDTARGYQWWNEAILSGSGRDIYGQTLGTRKYLYAAPDQSVWLVDLDLPISALSQDDLEQPFSFDVNIQRFGVIDLDEEVPAPVTTVEASIADLQQSSPILYKSLSTSLIEAGGIMSLADTNRDGSKALIAILSNIAIADDDYSRRPIGFLLLELARDSEGQFTATLTVARSRSSMVEVNRTFTDNSVLHAYEFEYSMTAVEHHNDIDTSGENCQGSASHTASVASVTATEIPVDPDSNSPGIKYKSYEIDFEETLVRTLDVWMDADGVLHDVTIETRRRELGSIGPPTDFSSTGGSFSETTTSLDGGICLVSQSDGTEDIRVFYWQYGTLTHTIDLKLTTPSGVRTRTIEAVYDVAEQLQSNAAWSAPPFSNPGDGSRVFELSYTANPDGDGIGGADQFGSYDSDSQIISIDVDLRTIVTDAPTVAADAIPTYGLASIDEPTNLNPDGSFDAGPNGVVNLVSPSPYDGNFGNNETRWFLMDWMEAAVGGLDNWHMHLQPHRFANHAIGSIAREFDVDGNSLGKSYGNVQSPSPNLALDPDIVSSADDWSVAYNPVTDVLDARLNQAIAWV